jgi:hypothetical protein
MYLNMFFNPARGFVGVVRGTFWGELGFFKMERGINALFLEDGDCWYAEPEFEMERKVRRGDLVGTMYGVVEGDGSRSGESNPVPLQPAMSTQR